MRHDLKRSTAAGLALLAGLVGCSKPGGSAATSGGEKKITIGLSLDTLREERWQYDRDFFVKRAEELGAKVLVQSSNSNATLQNSQAENLLTQGVDVLVVVPNNAKTAATIGMGLVGAFGLANSHLLWTREAYPTRAYQSLGNLAPGGRRSSGGPGDAYGIPEGIGVGDPDIISAAIERWESQGVTGINFLLNAVETVPQAEVLDSMRLFAREVMPRFRES